MLEKKFNLRSFPLLMEHDKTGSDDKRKITQICDLDDVGRN